MANEAEASKRGFHSGFDKDTMEDLRRECSILRQRVDTLESEKAGLAAQVAAWKKLYAESQLSDEGRIRMRRNLSGGSLRTSGFLQSALRRNSIV
mmetsp:Transcript_55602/g.86360  ORF Transcript_55602/g.86360 Transcript_55602/m.86360 type:complete len:95 (-) Transcript_55602:112-396(-)